MPQESEKTSGESTPSGNKGAMTLVGTVKPTLELFEGFIKIGKELAKLPALVTPQYKPAAKDLYKISQNLLTANEKLSRWLFKFLYFDFRQTDARGKFLALVGDYKTMKSGPEYHKLKVSCGDLRAIYNQHIAGKLGKWFSDQNKLAEATSVFNDLIYSDQELVNAIYNNVLMTLNKAVDAMENYVNSDSFDQAELTRLQTKTEMRPIIEALEVFVGGLSELVIEFAAIAGVPVTL